MVSLEERVRELICRLEAEYGLPEWEPGEPISVLIQTILSQNTSDTNSHAAFRSLRDCFRTWEEVAAADVDAIVQCIDRGGLARIVVVQGKCQGSLFSD